MAAQTAKAGWMPKPAGAAAAVAAQVPSSVPAERPMAPAVAAPLSAPPSAPLSAPTSAPLSAPLSAPSSAPPSAQSSAPAEKPSIPEMPDDEVLYDLADVFRVFGDSTRIKILYALYDHELCVQDIAQALGSSQSAISHQLRVLKDARLVRFRRDGKAVYYALDDDHVRTILSLGMEHVEE